MQSAIPFNHQKAVRSAPNCGPEAAPGQGHFRPFDQPLGTLREGGRLLQTSMAFAVYAHVEMRTFSTLCLLFFFAPSIAGAQWSITWKTDETLETGVRLRTARMNMSASAGSEFYVAQVDLCTDGISMASTAPRTSLSRTSAWADPGGIRLAVNGDFYERIGGNWMTYGDAVGNGAQWPCENNGRCLGDWHWAGGNYGWIAVGDGWVDFTHSEYIKLNREAYRAAGYSVDGGHAPTTPRPDPRPGTFALISGFSELVIEGRAAECPDPVGGCFADRGDMAARHPRTAIGITADRRTLQFVVVDGRNRRASVGATGLELAWLMAQVGAWQAFNLDGGGSSTMWARGRGIVNSPSDGSERSVLNHVGIFTGGSSGAVNCCGDELCNGEDDDCDGVVDDGVLNACGSCGPVPTESCNGEDDDCDGAVDEAACISEQDASTMRSDAGGEHADASVVVRPPADAAVRIDASETPPAAVDRTLVASHCAVTPGHRGIPSALLLLGFCALMLRVGSNRPGFHRSVFSTWPIRNKSANDAPACSSSTTKNRT